jgi:hypothetical protein
MATSVAVDRQSCIGGWAREAEESPLLEAVAKKRLMKKQQAGKGLAGAIVIYEWWRLAIAL